VVDLRIYRASFVIGLFAVLVAMFSFQERPRPLGATLAPDAFDGTQSYVETGRVVDRYPDREPGSTGDEHVGNFVESQFRALGFETSRDRFTGTYDGHDVSMSNVVGVLSAPSDRQIVVIAPRDSADRPGASTASDTGVLLALADALDGSSRHRTFVFVSADGAAADSAGARRFVDHYPDRGKVDAVLVLEDVGAEAARRPFVVPWSSDSHRSSLQISRTASAELAREADAGTGSPSFVGQFLRQAWPLTLREQGPLVAGGLDAVTLTSHGEVQRSGSADNLDGISKVRLGLFGRAAFGTLLAYDGAPKLDRSPSRYLLIGRKVIPDWAIALLAAGFAIPALVASVDAFARTRRRGLPIGSRLRWVLAAAVPFLLTLLVAFAFELLGWLPRTASAALAPATRPTDGESLPALAALALVFGLAWVLVRRAAAGPRNHFDHPDPAAGVALALLLSFEVLLVCAFNPFTALILMPAAHVAVLAAQPRRPRRAGIAAATLGVALALPVAAVVYYGTRLDLGFDPTRYVLMLLGSAGGSPLTALLFSLVAGTLASALIAAFGAVERREADAPVTVRGPATYAGPGSLGGTESALRR